MTDPVPDKPATIAKIAEEIAQSTHDECCEDHECAWLYDQRAIIAAILSKHWPSEDGARRKAAARVRKYIEQYESIRGLHPKLIHSLHEGTEREARLTMADLKLLSTDTPKEG